MADLFGTDPAHIDAVVKNIVQYYDSEGKNILE
jgi:hypothetical protein